MASRKLILGGAGAAALSMRLAQWLRARWRGPVAPDHKQLPAPATPDPPATPPDLAAAAASLRLASESLGAARTETASAPPDLSAKEVERLRGDLRRELERLANPDVKASRTGLSTPPQG